MTNGNVYKNYLEALSDGVMERVKEGQRVVQVRFHEISPVMMMMMTMTMFATYSFTNPVVMLLIT